MVTTFCAVAAWLFCFRDVAHQVDKRILTFFAASMIQRRISEAMSTDRYCPADNTNYG